MAAKFLRVRLFAFLISIERKCVTSSYLTKMFEKERESHLHHQSMEEKYGLSFSF